MGLQLNDTSSDGETRIRALFALLPANLMETNSLAYDSQEITSRA